MIKSRRVVPGKLLQRGYRFQFLEVNATLDDLLSTR